MFDGTEAKAWITHQVKLNIIINGEVQTINFNVADVGNHNVILGFDWLFEFNPMIDWRAGTVSRGH